MTKSTKIIAALGVAAGLGIASLPAGAIFAQDDLIPFDYTTAESDDVNVTVRLTVGEALAIATEGTECEATVNGDDFTIKSAGNCSQKVAGGTNALYGFTLYVEDEDSDTDLVRTGATTANGRIEAVDGGLGDVSGTWTAGWNLTGGALNQAAIAGAGSGQIVMRTNNAHDAQISMTYNVATKEAQEQGEYSDVIVYSIEKNNDAVTTNLQDGDITENGQNS